MNKETSNFQRKVKDHWYVKYEQASFPFIQKGWILPVDRWADFDPFILMAEDWFKRGAFSDHPHRGFQTITYVVDGRLEHIDNGGGRDILEPGDVQYMNAGWAARHAEEGVEDDIAHTLQLWLNLPKNLRKTATSYQNIYAEDAPVMDIEGGSVKVFSGDFGEVKGPLDSVVPITLAEINLEKGANYIHSLPEAHNAFLYVLSGDLDLGNEQDVVRLTKHGVATLTYNEGGDSLRQSEFRIKSNSRRSKVLIYSGTPIKEEIVPYGPFVMNSMEEIKQAYTDYREGKFGPPAI
ncbi:pirin [Alkalihalobacillus alcalophilus ATCC 27647 = CGMCC 1.3604]|uniref:Pirin n=1 Tax=Alkalihalobacillus alcalophilus ATCC 27647 = CGMCC 1.3604 TaxID=1218173 RepID=A0A094YZE7_ALKAL|nr:pirin-like C-terminal cupin domain-containing protein [Alkalihalobacillus alcalophilus]KGA98937.1 pirin [Alkalihalobacillus alcalophilus ATCC 27647 = CGMCC 1.3604]MED1561969.1 pirin-like C-terminal cupin domain-containing protein [Alkalihalobacillus alcalophilus]THG90336.1 pirin [Alkalihalobacillus alcalophilus ATCC 27647 = CGMCC 1.3604]